MIKCSKALGEIIERRKRYFTPDEMETVNVASGKLILLEEMEEQGRLVILPCKVGSTVYRIITRRLYCVGEKDIVEVEFNLGMLDEIGKSVFLTREEAAEAMLKGEREDV